MFGNKIMKLNVTGLLIMLLYVTRLFFGLLHTDCKNKFGSKIDTQEIIIRTEKNKTSTLKYPNTIVKQKSI